MRKFIFRVLVIAAISAGSVQLLFAWGLWGHQHINHSAVFSLPVEMRMFFFNHIDFITEESTIPDLRKYTLKDKAENPRHYIDIEEYDSLPVYNLPLTMKEAMEKYDEKTLQKQGILPWYIQDVMEKLTQAFKSKRRAEILFLAADLGHYIGDANMPLHTSANHNGQLTNQKGIHSFWEAQLPEHFGSKYNYRVGEAVYIKDITAATWDMIRHSHSLADTLLLADRKLKASFDTGRIFKKDSEGNAQKNIYGQLIFSDEYANAYHNALKGMVEAQMRHAIQDLANFWYTAWVNAGKPNLNDLDPEFLTQSNKKRYKKELKEWKNGKMIGFMPEKEYR